MISIIVAMSDNRVIGVKNKLPWHISEDLRHFKRTTLNRTIIMGRKTWESLPKKPLPKRNNIVITSQLHYDAPGAIVCDSFGDAISEAYKFDNDIFIIGGEQIYKQALVADVVDKVYLTHVHQIVGGDAFFPDLHPNDWYRNQGKITTNMDTGLSYSFDVYERL